MIIYQCDKCGEKSEPLKIPGYLPNPPVGWQMIEIIRAKEDNRTHVLCLKCRQFMGLDKLQGRL